GLEDDHGLGPATGFHEVVALAVRPLASLTPRSRQTSPTGVACSTWRSAYAICSSENFERFIGPPPGRAGPPKPAAYFSFDLSSFSGPTSIAGAGAMILQPNNSA